MDREASVAKHVCWLREGRGICQLQLGSDLYLHGFGMHQTTVAKLEAKPLRLNEVAAMGAHFAVPVESLWPEGGAVLNEHEIAVLLEEIAGYDVTRAKAIEGAQRASAVVRQASIDLAEAQATVVRTAKARKILDERLAAAQAADAEQMAADHHTQQRIERLRGK
jgi:hypothetical protein